MNYPLISEYIEAIKAAEENFDELKNLRPVLDEDGEPVMTSGNFAVVFKMKNEQTGKLHAVKCFLKEQEGRAEAYRMIAEELENVNSTFLTPIKYLDKELFVDSKNSDETEFPVLLMDWVEGMTLDKYILHNKYDGYKLACLTQNFYELSKWLLSQSFAHGDLKPDNIIITDEGKIVLVDYDGMYVPKMFGQEAREQGSPCYRVPNDGKITNTFCKSIDDFAIVHILLSLRVYSLFPHLLSKERDFAIFNYDEITNIGISPIYKEIHTQNIDLSISTLLALFHKCAYSKRIDLQDLELLNFTVNEDQYIDIEEQMCSLDNILYAMNLAYSSMKYKDPARNEYEVNDYSEVKERIGLAKEIQGNLRSHEWPYGFHGIKYSRLKPNGIDYREGVVLDLAEYTLRYLWGLIKYNTVRKTLPNYVYSGGEDVFTLSNDDYKYEAQLDEFVKIQESYSQQYKYLYVFDIRNFFKSINIEKLKDFYFVNTFSNVEWFERLFTVLIGKDCLDGINPCSEVDFFFANLYLRPLDNEMSKYKEIKYLRYCDDIRIFSNNDNLLDFLNTKLQDVLSTLSLAINSEKTKKIDTAKDKVALQAACFVWSNRLYLGINDADTLLSGKSLEEIIEEGLTTTYIFQLLKDIDNKAKRIYWDSTVHIGPLFYILKTVHKNATFYRVVSELIFDIGMNYEQYDCEVMGLPPAILKKIINLLKDDSVEPFVKYWVIRTFFCSSKNYYEWYSSNTMGYCHDYIEQIKAIMEVTFRKEGQDALLYHLSDYILSLLVTGVASEQHNQTSYLSEDIADAWTDEYGVMYNASRKKLLKTTEKSYLEEYNIREGTEIICDGAFSECYNVTRIAFPISLKSLGVESFFECLGLTNIIIPENVKTIGDKAFYNCVNIESILILSRELSIGEQTFSNCCNLASVVVDNNSTYDSREDCNAIIETLNNKLVVGCNNTIIPNTITNIGDYAFSYREKLTNIAIPNAVRTIGKYAFLGCRSLTTIDIPNSVTSIGEGAFAGCRGLTCITIPSSVSYINDSVFAGCTSLRCIYISKGTKAEFEKYLPDNKGKLIEQV